MTSRRDGGQVTALGQVIWLRQQYRKRLNITFKTKGSNFFKKCLPFIKNVNCQTNIY